MQQTVKTRCRLNGEMEFCSENEELFQHSRVDTDRLCVGMDNV